MNLLPNSSIQFASGPTTAGTSEIDSNAVDMAGFENVVFVASLASVASTGVVTLTAQGRDTTTGSWADLAASVSHTSSGSETNRLIALEIVRPMVRYVRCKITRATANTAVNSVVAIVAAEGQLPATQPAGVDTNSVLSPSYA